jgi:hypothetical protein
VLAVFRLHKWFLDCVTPSGDAVVVYSARLHWGVLRLGCASVLVHRGGRTTSRTRILRPPMPQVTANGIAIAAPRLGIHGTWRGAPQSRPRELFRSPRGSVAWNCHLPQAEVELQCDGQSLRGTGYVEHLALDVAPWQLPIDELHWGRWHGGGRSLVWIQWRGPHPLRLCLFDGDEVAAQHIDTDGVQFGAGHRLALTAKCVLRAGELGRTVLAERALRWLPLPRAIRAMQETKWVARGTLTTDRGEIDGTALHEVVRWA